MKVILDIFLTKFKIGSRYLSVRHFQKSFRAMLDGQEMLFTCSTVQLYTKKGTFFGYNERDHVMQQLKQDQSRSGAVRFKSQPFLNKNVNCHKIDSPNFILSRGLRSVFVGTHRA